MHLSHLGLTVSHIPSATSFYLACLQPLGYRYIGQRGDSIGLGITTADFFLSQEQNGDRIAPTHIAFAADDRHSVRDCYAAALHAGAAPSGAPSYRNDDCTCFNAAVRDFDGNTIEFVFDETCAAASQDGGSIAPSRHSRGPDTHIDPGRKGGSDGSRSVRSTAERAGSRCQTALDLASATSRPVQRSDEPAPGIARSRTEPIFKPNGNALVGTIIGAAAGAAFVYAAWSTERKNAHDEAVYLESVSKPRSSGPPPASTTRSVPRRSESTSSRRYPPRSLSRALPRAIEAPPAFDDQVWERESATRYTAPPRPADQARSRTHDSIPSDQGRHSENRSIAQRSTTQAAPEEQRSRAPSSTSRKTTTTSHTSRRSSADETPPESKPKEKGRHDSVVGASASQQSPRHRGEADETRRSSTATSTSSASTVKPSRSQRRSSGSVHTAAEVPLPASRVGSYCSASPSAAQISLPASRVSSSSYRSARSASKSALPPARIGRGRSISRDSPTLSRDDVFTSRDVLGLDGTAEGPMQDGVGVGPEVGYESDGLGDCKTVVPDDSISCVDFSARDSRRGERRSSAGRRAPLRSSSSKPTRSSRRSETAESERTVRPLRRDSLAGGGRIARSAVALPVRTTSKLEPYRTWRSAAMDGY